MASPIAPVSKPKKKLTEAQRLAFLKGREKRMANLEKARLAKEEAKQQDINEPASAVVIKEEVSSPVLPEPIPPTTHVIDSDEIANKVVKLMLEKNNAKPKSKPKPKPRSVTPPPPPKYTADFQPTTTFNWL